MTSLAPPPAPVEDTQLLRLAVTPRPKLFPTLNRASAFAPLIVACCVLPAFQLLAKPTLNELGSLWGLRSLGVARASSVQEFMEPGFNEPGQPLLFQPPLAAWLNGIVATVIGPSQSLSASLVSLVAAGISIWLTTRLAWRFGGANTALVSAFLMCSHPQLLALAITSENGAIGLCLILATVFGVQRHFEVKGAPPLTSPSLWIGGFVFGLSILAIGPVALVVPMFMSLSVLSLRSIVPAIDVAAANTATGEPPNGTTLTPHQTISKLTSLKSILIFTTVGLVCSGWWGLLMLTAHGTPFLRSWWAGLPVECLARGSAEWRCDLRPLLQPAWQDWFRDQALILPWLVVGLERSWHVWRRHKNETIRQRHLLLMLWWSVAVIGRVAAELLGRNAVSNTELWNLALLGPTVLLASLGIGTLIERAVSRRGEFFLITLLVSLTLARVCGSWLIGLTGGACAATFLICGPLLIPSAGRSANAWTEAAWRQLLQVTAYGSLFACLSAGLGLRTIESPDDNRLSDLRDRLKNFPNVQRISLIATRDPVPVSLRYLLRCRWPQAEIVTSEGWDAGLTAAMAAESKSPKSRFLVLEWTRCDGRLSADAGQNWQLTNVGDPMRFHGRRLSALLIEPRG